MVGLISGQAGWAVIPRGKEVTAICIDLSDPITYGFPSVPYLFGGATDVQVTRDTDAVSIRRSLQTAWNRDRSLRMVMILLEREEYAEVRREGAEHLESFFSDAPIYDWISDRLFSAPLPSDADAEGALAAAKGLRGVEALLTEVTAHQTAILRWRMAWDSISEEVFETRQAKAQFELAAVESG